MEPQEFRELLRNIKHREGDVRIEGTSPESFILARILIELRDIKDIMLTSAKSDLRK